METIKEKIKVLSQEQKELRNQRKTVYIKGERTFPAIGYLDTSNNSYKWVKGANEIHRHNRYQLRHLFAAYAKSRGKHFECKKPIDEKLVNQYLKQYGKTICSSK